MDRPTGGDEYAPAEPGEPSVSVGHSFDPADVMGVNGDGLAPDEAFQTLASEVRVSVLVELLRAERRSDEPLSFSRLQSAVGADSSAGFAYHLRQLSGYFVRKTGSGYVLTAAGRRTAEAVVSGSFTIAGDGGRAS